jgi:UDP-N-acetylmuramate: L-alanyl-gamma-D-glutamyl-meso-diaminopimelate ligase
MWKVGKVEETVKGFEFEIVYKGRSAGVFKTPLFGEHNLANLISGIVCAVNLGITIDQIRPIVERFHNAKRRQEILLESPVYLIDDFAHHPTEVAVTLKGARRRYPGGKLWALFEPRSATARRSVHQEAYTKAFDSADEILVAGAYKAQDLKEAERFSTDTLVTDLVSKGKSARAFESVEEIVTLVSQNVQPGDIVVVMSNGEFGKIQEKLLKALK